MPENVSSLISWSGQPLSINSTLSFSALLLGGGRQREAASGGMEAEYLKNVHISLSPVKVPCN